LEGTESPADVPSRRPDYKVAYKRLTARLLATWGTNTVEPYDDLLQEITTALAIDELGADVKPSIVGTPIVDIPDLQRIDELEEHSSNEWKVTTGVLTYKGRINVPKDDLLRNKVIHLFHHNPESGHFGALKTAQLVFGDIYWPAMDATVQKYIAGCELCH